MTDDIAYEEPTLGDEERVLGFFFGGSKQWGGKLVVTDQRLLFAPLDLGALPDVLAYAGDKLGVPGVDIGKTVLEQVRGSVKKDVKLQHVASVEPEGNAGWTGPPKVRIETVTGEVIKIGIVKSAMTPNPDAGNNEVRDRAVAVIRKAVKAKTAKSG